MTATVTVITLAYNFEKYIGACIQSTVDQTFDDWRLILIDDASTDKTYEVMKKYESSKVTVIRNEKRVGAAKNLNTAISMADTPFVTWIGGDDIAYPGRLQALLMVYEGVHMHFGRPVILHHSADKIDHDNKVVELDYIHRLNKPLPNLPMFDRLLLYDFIFGNPFFQKEVIRDTFPVPDESECPDWIFFLNAARKYHFVYFPVPLTWYRVHSGGTNSQMLPEWTQRHIRERTLISKLYKLTETQNDMLFSVFRGTKYESLVNKPADD